MRTLALVVGLLALSACVTTSRAVAEPPGPTIESFDGGLAPYGEWVVTVYGRAWRPLGVPYGWRPYFYGEWEWTDDGWFWVTDEPWGWATYHYGRWTWDPAFGWVWVPGFEWAPAWVAWRYGDGFIGWAPLFPGIVTWWVDYPLDPGWWIFVPSTRFVGVRVDVVALPPTRVSVLLRETRPAPPPQAAPRPAPSPAPPRGGPPRRFVEGALGRSIPPARVVPVPSPGEARGRVTRERVPVFRPSPPRGAAPRPQGERARREEPRPAPARPPAAAPPAIQPPPRAAPPPARPERKDEGEREERPRRP